MSAEKTLHHSLVVGALLVATLLSSLALGAEPPARAAGGRGPELRSRVTHALEELQSAVAADPSNGRLWWTLGIQAQVAAGGSVKEERVAVEFLERALLLSPDLAMGYDNAMAIGDMHRGVRNASRSRHFYATASQAEPLAQTQYMYAGLTYELEGNFALAAQAFMLASRVQEHHTRHACRSIADVARYAAACWPSHRGSAYLAYLTAALMKAGNASQALASYSLALGLPPRQSLEAECATQRIANAATGALVALPAQPPPPHPTRPHDTQHRTDSIYAQADADSAYAQAIRQADAAIVQAAIRRHQFPHECSGKRKLLYVYSQAFGFGAHAHMLSLALSLALYTNRVLVPVDEEAWWLVSKNECGRAGFSCFFEDFTNCSVTPAQRAAAPSFSSLRALAFSSSSGPLEVVFSWQCQTAAIKMGYLRHYVPRFPGQARLHGGAWWRGQLLLLLMQPRAWFVRELEHSKASMRWQEPVVGLHIRHGDKLKEANRLSAADYLRVVLPVARLTGARTLFVSTDSPDILAELQESAGEYSGWLRLVYEKDEIRGTDITNANLQNNLRLNVTRYTSEAARGVLLLANTSLLFCTFSSNFGRLAYELQLSRPNPPPPLPLTLHMSTLEKEKKRQLLGVQALSLDLPWFAYP